MNVCKCFRIIIIMGVPDSGTNYNIISNSECSVTDMFSKVINFERTDELHSVLRTRTVAWVRVRWNIGV